MPDKTRLNLSAGLASVATALVLVGLKLWALGSTQSLSVAASLADSALDLMMSLGALAAIFYAARPPDDDHAFGHSSAEDLAALGQAVFILASATVIGVAALLRLISSEVAPLSAEGRGMIAMGLSILLTLGLVLWQRRVAARTGSRVVQADALHYLGDLIPNLGAIVALWASAEFGLARLDAVIALAAAGMLAVGALGIGRGAWDALMDRAAEPEVIARIEELARTCAGVHGFHDLKTRRAGTRLFVNLHIELDGTQSLNDAHTIGATLKHNILSDYPGADVIIHFDPVRDG
ncbi:Cobalt-zinc-cadmium resistance protein [Rhodovulum sp. P5]|uniref:cation diffusion facilitator family transporter n=1 Tax=Rhodovulum sp. P5 TaxID=1564506 RepID=UPI0009C2D849|nr:cation diffusion facilitator family transporter [Rhodovulum sp. P5]ARE39764.1 Cobalt-zinc-cadmium resistance protein [Rhodovulum sp. P5]